MLFSLIFIVLSIQSHASHDGQFQCERLIVAGVPETRSTPVDPTPEEGAPQSPDELEDRNRGGENSPRNPNGPDYSGDGIGGGGNYDFGGGGGNISI